MKFLLGALALVAASPVIAEGYPGYPPYPVTNGVPDYGSDAYREYSIRQGDTPLGVSTEAVDATIRQQMMEMDAEDRHRDVMRRLDAIERRLD